MIAHNFGQKEAKRGIHLTLVASVRHAGQLMFHEELLSLDKQFPQHFRYQPVLTRSWPDAWRYLKGRIVRVMHAKSGNDHIDITPLQSIVPDLPQSHLRMCGNVTACRQLILGLEQGGIVPLTVRAESW
jgi:ferredoxin-NADP reductase